MLGSFMLLSQNEQFCLFLALNSRTTTHTGTIVMFVGRDLFSSKRWLLLINRLLLSLFKGIDIFSKLGTLFINRE